MPSLNKATRHPELVEGSVPLPSFFSLVPKFHLGTPFMESQHLHRRSQMKFGNEGKSFIEAQRTLPSPNKKARHPELVEGSASAGYALFRMILHILRKLILRQAQDDGLAILELRRLAALEHPHPST